MHLSALTVCVNYAHLLANSIARWAEFCDRLIIITDFEDKATHDLCVDYRLRHWSIELFRTNSFYWDGAVFNKARAICEAVSAKQWLADGWNMFFDADIVPDWNWRYTFEDHNHQPGNLYGAKRYLENGQCYNEYELAGYFQIFHSSDPNIQRAPLLETNWRHAGGYDSEFAARWKEHQRIFLPIHLLHQGEPGKNWWGKGNEEMMDQMIVERLKTNRLAECERIKEK